MLKLHFSKLSFSLFAVLLLCSIGQAAEPGAKACCEADGFEISLPSGWVRVPDAALQLFAKKIHELNPSVPKNLFRYAFQDEGNERWFAYPYILVQVNRSGRLEAEQLANYKKASELSSAVKKDFSDLLAKLDFGEVIYDQTNKIIWSKTSSRVAAIGDIHAISGSLLTSDGAITIHCYATRRQFEKLLPFFENLISSVTLRSELKS